LFAAKLLLNSPLIVWIAPKKEERYNKMCRK
jgi:hypothetical protein